MFCVYCIYICICILINLYLERNAFMLLAIWAKLLCYALRCSAIVLLFVSLCCWIRKYRLFLFLYLLRFLFLIWKKKKEIYLLSLSVTLFVFFVRKELLLAIYAIRYAFMLLSRRYSLCAKLLFVIVYALSY